MAHAASRPSQRILQRESTRRSILAAARVLFREKGVDAVAIEDVARAAAVGRATVYLHFSGKQALLADLLREDWNGQVRLFEQLGRSGALDRPAIAAWLGRVIDGMRKARGSFGIHRVALGQDTEMAALHRAHRRRLALVFAARIGRAEDAGPVADRVEAALIVAEIEYLASAAATEWEQAEIDAGVALLAHRIATFAKTC